jgi:hypothetical protein
VISVQAIVLSLESLQIRRNHNSLKSLSFFFSPALSRAVDQLQVAHDQLVAQRAETKRLSEQIAEPAEKLDALQQSVANLPAPSTHAAGSPPASPKPP